MSDKGNAKPLTPEKRLGQPDRDAYVDGVLLFGQIFERLHKLTDEHLRLLGIQIVLLLQPGGREEG